MIEENRASKLKQYKNLILTVGSVFGISAIFLFYGQPKQNQSDISKIINSKNKIMLQDPNRGLKAEDRWIEEAGQKLEDYDEFQKNYGEDKSHIESRLAEVEKKYEDTISAQSELLEGQGKQIEELKNQISFAKQGINSKDPFTIQGQEGAMQALPPAPKTIHSVHLNLEEDKSDEGEFFNSEDYVPSGAYAPATIISGVDASVGISSQSDPRPILLRIKGPALSSIYDGNAQKADLTGCLVTGAASGDLSSEKVYVKLVNMTCSKSENLLYETAIKGYVAGQGKSGVRGNVIGREGDFLAKSFLAGLVSGFGSGLSSRVAPPLSFSSGVTLQNGYSNEDIAKKGVGQGISSASDRLSNYYISRAEQYQPVVSIPSGIEVEVVFVEGFHLNGKRHRKPSTISNKFINRFEDGQK
jgi:hypothetical protein